MKHRLQILFLVTMLITCTMYAALEQVTPESGNLSVKDESTTSTIINNTVTVSGTGTATNQTSSKSSSAALNLSKQSVLDSFIGWFLSGWIIEVGNNRSKVVIKT